MKVLTEFQVQYNVVFLRMIVIKLVFHSFLNTIENHKYFKTILSAHYSNISEIKVHLCPSLIYFSHG